MNTLHLVVFLGAHLDGVDQHVFHVRIYVKMMMIVEMVAVTHHMKHQDVGCVLHVKLMMIVETVAA